MERNRLVTWLKESLSIKEGVNNLDLLFIHPHLMVILGFVSTYAYENNIKLHVTSIVRSREEDIQVKSQSVTHRNGRAFDFSIKECHGWTYEKIQRLVDEVNKRYTAIGAISASDGIPRPIVIHGEGDNIHAHVQVRGNIKDAISKGKL